MGWEFSVSCTYFKCITDENVVHLQAHVIRFIHIDEISGDILRVHT